MSFALLTTTTITTKRRAAIDPSTGKSSGMATNLQSVKIAPLMPVSQQTLERAGLEGQATERLETYCQSHAHTDSGSPVTQMPDIKQGDVLTVSGDDYTVIWVGDWPAGVNAEAFLQIVVEQPKP